MLVTGLGVTEQERLEHLQLSHMDHCERRKEQLMNSSGLAISQLDKLLIPLNIGPLLVFMMKHLRLSGCDVPRSNILCAPCDMTKAGGFNPDPGAVILCGGHFFSKQHMESTIAHELLHLYDHCRFKVDWSNLRHHACSEVCSSSQSFSFFVTIRYLSDSCQQLERRLSVYQRTPARKFVLFKAASSQFTSF